MATNHPFDLWESETDSFHKFASTTVHHLREPVRMINTHAEILQATVVSEEALESLGFLRTAAMQMQQLLAGIAEFANACAETGRPHAIRLDLPLRQALLQLDEKVKSTGTIIRFDPLPVVTCDFDQMQLVFHHLLRNALEYGTAVPPQISISARETQTEWIIQVDNNGPGIEPEFHEKIFNLYTRLHGKSHPGNGLGLAICKTIIAGHKGRIWVESVPGGGTQFCFTLPHGGIGGVIED